MVSEETLQEANEMAARFMREGREEAGLTVREVASRFDGLSERELESYESGVADVDMVVLVVLSRFYGRDPYELISAIDDVITRHREDEG